MTNTTQMSAHEDTAMERQLFERWITRRKYSIARTEAGDYESAPTSLAWDAWQERASFDGRTPGETARSALSRASGSEADR